MRGFLAQGGLWVVAQAVVLLAVFGLPYVLADSVWPWPPATRPFREAAGILLMLSGLLEMAFGGLHLGRNLTPLPRPKSSAGLIQTGVFRWVRHPIYGGIMLLGLGALLRDPSMMTMPLAIPLIVFFNMKATREEQWLKERYPEYSGYRGRTRKLIPFVY